jgi:hypothetical protein
MLGLAHAHVEHGAVQVQTSIPEHAFQAHVQSGAAQAHIHPGAAQAHVHQGAVQVNVELFRINVFGRRFHPAAMTAITFAILALSVRLLWSHIETVMFVAYSTWPCLLASMLTIFGTNMWHRSALRKHVSALQQYERVLQDLAASPRFDFSMQPLGFSTHQGKKFYFVQDDQVHELWRETGAGWKLLRLADGHPRPDPRFNLSVICENGTSILYRAEVDGHMHEIWINARTNWKWKHAPRP